MSVTGLTMRHIGECFQRSNDTISRYFHKMLDIFSSPPFHTMYVQLPTGKFPPQRIQNNPKFWPYFQNTIFGAINGSHIHASAPAFLCANYHNCK
ncbi:hypothetical protein PAXRUDRAFT_55532, partial [Paxillus rubicundulus Ve08.2h10]